MLQVENSNVLLLSIKSMYKIQQEVLQELCKEILKLNSFHPNTVYFFLPTINCHSSMLKVKRQVQLRLYYQVRASVALVRSFQWLNFHPIELRGFILLEI